ncbi:MAG: SGNH/GDSL hydrolase family protein, partial [Acidobacteriota bacterium]
MVAVCLGLGILEGGMRLAGFGPLPTSPVTRNQEILYQYTKFRPSRSLIWELVPGWSGREGHGTVTISSQGLREREISLRPPAGRKRILCLGDSVTFGHWVEAWEAFPRRLEETLLGRGEPVQVINAGVPGYSPFQEMTWLHEKGWTYEPDLVVVAFVLNDVVERFSTLAAYGGSHTVLGIDTTATLSPLNRFLHRTAFYHLVVSLLRFHARRREIYSVRRLFEEPLTPAVERAWRITEGELDEMVQASRQHHVPLLLVAFPFRFQISEHLPPKPQHRLASWAAARQVPFLDL